jgi:hypothetical protein
MAEPEFEAAWRNEFKRIHATEASDSDDLSPDDPKATVLWSGDEAETQRLQEEHTHHYLRGTFFGAVAAMIVGLIGVALSFVN